jgi:hypothetical protein
MQVAKIVGWVALGLVGIMALTFILNAMGWANFAFWAPKYEDTKRDVFENTQSYVQGKAAHLTQLRLEYESTESDNRKAALRTMILSEAANVDRTKLPTDLQLFLNRLEGSSF